MPAETDVSFGIEVAREDADDDWYSDSCHRWDSAEYTVQQIKPAPGFKYRVVKITTTVEPVDGKVYK